MILKLGMKYQGKELYKVHINHEPRMASTYITARPMGKKMSKFHLKGATGRKWANGLKIYDSEKRLKGLVDHQTGAI